MAIIEIDTLDQLNLVASKFAASIAAGDVEKMFLSGGLGCGKTTFVCAIVANLPGAENCEPASPSFNICNFYSTRPPMWHCDLYRCKNNLPEDVEELIYTPCCRVAVEWPEWLNSRPDNYLDIEFKIEQNKRLLDIKCFGQSSFDLLNDLRIK